MRKLRSMRVWWLGLMMLAFAASSWAEVSIGISVHVGPPALPVYEQPVCPGVGYIWTPGYWAYGPAGYYWVPGTWVMAPAVGLLWTPGYWGWGGGGYLWHAGYWGPHVGFYGGVNYGFSYVGVGYVGGRWDHGVFAYNTAVTHVDTTIIHTTYVNRTVINNVTVNRVSYNGGAGGLSARPSAQEEAALHERHIAATGEQTQHEHLAANNHALLASVNHGRPAVAATSRPGEFSGRGAVAARQAAPRPAGNSRNVPRPLAQQARADSATPHGNSGMQHNAPRPESKPHAAPVAEHHNAAPHSQAAEHHEGGERNR
jgi:hypothetical protein